MTDPINMKKETNNETKEKKVVEISTFMTTMLHTKFRPPDHRVVHYP